MKHGKFSRMISEHCSRSCFRIHWSWI